MAGSAQPGYKRPRTASGEAHAQANEKDFEKRQERINRKRAQNRVSQQCIREKAHAHARQLEALTEMIKSTTQSDSQSDLSSHKALMQSHLKLIEENRELKDALLRMRKKFLSLGSAANAGADDWIFDRVIRGPVSKKGSKRARVPESEADGDDGEMNDTEYTEQNAMHQMSQPSSPSWLQPEDANVSLSSVHDRRTGNQDLSAQSMFQAGIVASDFVASEAVEQGREMSPSTQSIPILENGQTSNLQLPTLFPFVPSIHGRGVDKLFSDENIYKADKIEAACISYLSHRIGIRDLERFRRGNAGQLSCIRNEIAKYDLRPGLVTEVAKIGVKLIGRIGHKSEYIYGLGADDIMEKVLRWRCSPSPKNRMAIPEPFRPTILQTMKMDHSLSIDFINWPTIRDQLIFKAGTYDLTKVISDIVLNTVIELPRFNAAINIHDAFMNRVFNRTNTTYAHSELDFLTSLFENYDTVQDSSFQEVPSSDQEIQERIAQEMDQRNPSTAPLNHSQQPFHKQQLASKWGLDKLFTWKLSKEFAIAHPELDCSSVTSSFPMYSSSLIPEL